MPTDIEIYCNCIARVRHHVSIADTVLAGKIDTGHSDLKLPEALTPIVKHLQNTIYQKAGKNLRDYVLEPVR